MNGWKYLDSFHEEEHRDIENGKEGLAAVKSLQEVFINPKNSFFAHNHPIGTRLLRASIEDYNWII